MTIPNKLTIVRMILVIPFVIMLSISIEMTENYSYKHFNDKTILFSLSGIIFLIAMITDYFDGKIARKTNTITTFGKLFDPLADKLVTSSALIILSIGKIVPFWLTIIFLLRDILVDGFRNLIAAKNLKIGASKSGKIKTTILSIALIFIFVLYPIKDYSYTEKILLNIPIIIAMILSIYSGYKYFQNIIPLIFNK